MILSKKNRLLISKTTPLFLSNIIYLLIFYTIKMLLHNKNTKVWCRNSLYLRKTAFTLSDIDLTIFCSNDPEKKKRVVRKVKSVSSIFVLIGEVIYIDARFRKYFFCINWYEAKRDPYFAKLVSHRELYILEKEMFLIKMFEADISNLQQDFRARHTKWNDHLLRVGASAKLHDGSNLDCLVNTISLCSNDLGIAKMRGLLQSISEGNHSTAVSEYLFLRSPVLWIAISLKQQSYRENLLKVQGYSRISHSLAFEHLRWEAWGLYTQREELSRIGMSIHISNILKLIEFLNLSESKKGLLKKYFELLKQESV